MESAANFKLEDLVHLPVADAVWMAEGAGYEVIVKRTSPPRGPIEGVLRVVRANKEGNTITLTTAFYLPQQQ